jgi:PEP-CTERM motif
MNHNFGKLFGAALMGGLGVWTMAMPAHATTVTPTFEFGENVSISPGGPGASGTANATYINSNNGGNGYLGDQTPGVTSTLTSPGSNLTYSPDPAPGGLSSVALNLSSFGSAMDVSASMQSGTTHMYGYSIGDNVPGSSGVNTSNQSTIQFNDNLTFTVAGGGSDTITFNFALDGNIGNSTGEGFGNSWSMAAEETFGSALMNWQSGASLSPVTTDTAGWNAFSFTNNTQTGFNFTGTLTVTNGEVVPIEFLQQLSCSNGTICDYSNTAQMSLVLPSDVTYTSASGFLTQQAGSSSVPEPGSLSLVGLGIAAAVWARRRRFAR